MSIVDENIPVFAAVLTTDPTTLAAVSNMLMYQGQCNQLQNQLIQTQTMLATAQCNLSGALSGLPDVYINCMNNALNPPPTGATGPSSANGLLSNVMSMLYWSQS